MKTKTKPTKTPKEGERVREELPSGGYIEHEYHKPVVIPLTVYKDAAKLQVSAITKAKQQGLLAEGLRILIGKQKDQISKEWVRRYDDLEKAKDTRLVVIDEKVDEVEIQNEVEVHIAES